MATLILNADESLEDIIILGDVSNDIDGEAVDIIVQKTKDGKIDVLKSPLTPVNT